MPATASVRGDERGSPPRTTHYRRARAVDAVAVVVDAGRVVRLGSAGVHQGIQVVAVAASEVRAAEAAVQETVGATRREVVRVLVWTAATHSTHPPVKRVSRA